MRHRGRTGARSNRLGEPAEHPEGTGLGLRAAPVYPPVTDPAHASPLYLAALWAGAWSPSWAAVLLEMDLDAMAPGSGLDVTPTGYALAVA